MSGITPKMTASRLARLAYHAMVDNAARIQMEVVQQEAIDARFKDEALAVNKIMRSNHRNLLDGARKRDLSSMLSRHAEYMDAIREFEKLFELEEEQDLEAFANYFRQQNGQEPRRKKEKVRG